MRHRKYKKALWKYVIPIGTILCDGEPGKPTTKVWYMTRNWKWELLQG